MKYRIKVSINIHFQNFYMKNKFLTFIALISISATALVSCGKDETTTAKTDFSFTEEFDSVANTVARGWVISNNSKPLGTVSWINSFYYFNLQHGLTGGKTGGPVNYANIGGINANPAISGSDFIMTTSECGAGVAYCSNWLISPAVTMKNGDIIKFFTRTYDNPAIGADRLQLRLNSVDATAKVGVDTNSVGNFTNVLLDINPTYLLQGAGSYPGEWTEVQAVITGMPTPKKARVAFRYFVPNGGPQGSNGLGVGIDKFQFISAFK
jgi:hypothetical protein